MNQPVINKTNEREYMISIPRKGGYIHGILDFISSDCPIVIYCPGMNSVRSDVHRFSIKLSEKLSKKGVSFFRFDYTNLGISDGFFHKMNYYDKLEDIICVYTFLQNEFKLNQKTYLIGFSDGAKLVIEANNYVPCNLILLSPLLIDNSNERNIQNESVYFRNFENKIVIPRYGLAFSVDFFKSKKDIEQSMLDSILKIQDKALIIYGEKDDFVKESRSFFDSYYKEKRFKIIEIPNAEHIFTKISWETEVISNIKDWIVKYDTTI